jgi:3-hydroxyisobutyrate dehydrogenase-like beta-hydroxyacid dehydrogenase
MALQLAFIGLGTMGFPNAGHLAAAGHELVVYNRTGSRADQWIAKYRGRKAATPAEAAYDTDIVFICVGKDDDLRSVVCGHEGLLTRLKRGAIIVDHTTTSADVAREVAAAAQEIGVDFLDAPVSGGQPGAEKGQLTVMVGGALETFDRAKPLIEGYARVCVRIGEVGCGQLTKMVNQICTAGIIQGLSEGLAFAERSGLDGLRVIEVISKGAAQSWQMQNRGLTMLKGEFGFGFSVDWMRKDLAICTDEARRIDARLPAAGLVDQFYAEIQARGHGR